MQKFKKVYIKVHTGFLQAIAYYINDLDCQGCGSGKGYPNYINFEKKKNI